MAADMKKASTPEPKSCMVCGREISWRKKWARDWENIRYCSDQCRSHRLTPTDRALEAAIQQLLAQRGAGKTICPSEAARAVDPAQWEQLMEPARAAARRLVAQGAIVITQQGSVVDPSHAKGPIRLRRA
jgi:hypothetical protein